MSAFIMNTIPMDDDDIQYAVEAVARYFMEEHVKVMVEHKNNGRKYQHLSTFYFRMASDIIGGYMSTRQEMDVKDLIDEGNYIVCLKGKDVKKAFRGASHE